MKRILAGDVGGTKVHLALIERDEQGLRLVAEERFQSADYQDFTQIITEFRRLHPAPVDATGIGVAGPVFDRRCQATNLPWVIDARALEGDGGIGSVALVNDFKAAALGVLELQEGDWIELNPGAVSVPDGPIAVLGAGTGLGEAFLFHAGEGYHVVPTEGGHTDFAPRNEEEIELLRFLLRRHGRVSYERVLSGAGLRAIYDFLVESAYAPESEEVRQAMAREDAAMVISNFGLAKKDLLCEKALDLFVAIYGAETGNLALQIIAAGGIYLAGGIAAKNIEKMTDGTFLKAFLTKGRFSNMVGSMPVRLVAHPHVALLGAMAAAK